MEGGTANNPPLWLFFVENKYDNNMDYSGCRRNGPILSNLEKIASPAESQKKPWTALLIIAILLSPAILWAHDNLEVHPYIVEQAFFLWPNATDHEIYRYLGYGYRDHSGQDLWTFIPACENARGGSSITEGAKEEDDYDPIDEVCNIDVSHPGQVGKGYYHHFYDPDIPGIHNGLMDDFGAAYFAGQYWNTAKALYQNESTRPTAYWYLGRIAHLLADQSVPAHVHRQIHLPFFDPDSYETYVKAHYTSWGSTDARTLDATDPVPPDWKLEDLFFNLAERTQFFPSDDINGNVSNADPYWFLGWPDPAGWNVISGNKSYIPDDNLKIMGDKLMPLVIQYTSALYRLFWYEVHPEDRPLMPSPAGQEIFTYAPTVSPVLDVTASNAKPVGVGYIAKGGDTLTLKVSLPEFTSPVDIYFAIYAPSIDPFNIYMLHPDGSLQPASSAVEPWMSGVTSVNQAMFGGIPTSTLPKGTYTMGLMATPAGANMSTYYFWMTNFIIQ